MGGYERRPAPWALDGIPEGFEAKLLPEEWDRMEELFANAITRVPAMETAEVKMFFNGPEAFTPDADFLLGETDVPGFWVAAGGCAHGLAGAGGIGKVMGEWIVDGRPEWDVWPLDLRRFGRQYAASPTRSRARTRRCRSTTTSSTRARRSRRAAVARLARRTRATRARRVIRREGRLGARQLVRVERGGRRRVTAAARVGGGELVAGDRGRGACRAGAVCALRPVVVLQARGARGWALAFLERLCANRIDRPVGTIVYTQLLNGVEASRPTCPSATGRRPLPARHRHGVRQHDRPGSTATRRATDPST